MKEKNFNMKLDNVDVIITANISHKIWSCKSKTPGQQFSYGSYCNAVNTLRNIHNIKF